MSQAAGSYLEVASGPFAGRTAALQSGRRLAVGSSADADVVLPDPRMAALQFALEPLKRGGHRLRDLSPRGDTDCNGTSVTAAPVRDRDRIFAGFTQFVVHLDATDQPEPARSPLLQQMDGQQPLYAVLDAARSPRVLLCLQASGLRYETLLHGTRADELAEYGPFLVELSPEAALRETLTTEGWGQSWGIYCTCTEPFEALRAHLADILWAETPDGTLLFRFYDPRVLRVFLSNCGPKTTRSLFGPVGRFLLEDEVPERLLEFAVGAAGIERRVRVLSPSPEALDDEHPSADTGRGMSQPQPGSANGRNDH